MVSASNNQANPIRNHKVHVHWQGPYEVVAGSGPTSYQVQLLGDDAVATVHWRKMRRLAGPELQPDEEVIASALHDRQRFLVERFDDWIVDDDGDAILFVRWKHHGDEERTWEPLQQLWDDVPKMVEKYVADVEVPELTLALEEAQAASRATEDSSAPNPIREPATDNSTTDPQTDANLARDARAAARANRH